MKRIHIITILTCLLLSPAGLQACRSNEKEQENPVSEQTVTEVDSVPYTSMNKLMKNYHWKSGVIGFSMGTFILPILRTFIAEPEAKALLGDMHKMHFLVMEKEVADEELIRSFRQEFNLQKQEFEPLVQVNAEGSLVTLIGKLSKDSTRIKEVVISIDDAEGDLVVLDLLGSIEVEKLMGILAEQM